LIEERLEAMVILPVDHDHFGRCTFQGLGRLKAAKAGSDDYNPCTDR
jgi:hypothetical protein